jgi:DNA-binding Lrp family transcriptional regulator
MSFTELAEKCGISPTAVIRRYSRLREEGIILGHQMHLNPLSVGYESIAEAGILTELADKKGVKEALEKKGNFLGGIISLGKYDIYGNLFAKKIEDLNGLIQRIDIRPYVKSLDVLIFSDLWNSPWHPENLLIKPTDKLETTSRRAISQEKPEPNVLDETDLHIIRALNDNSRTPFKEIANNLNAAVSSIIQRYHSLKARNLWTLSTTIIDTSKLGYKANADIYIRVTHRSTLPSVEAQLLEIPNTTFLAKYVGGAYDLRVAVVVSNFEDFFIVKDRILAIPDISRAEFYFIKIPTGAHWLHDRIGETIIRHLLKIQTPSMTSTT